MSKDKIEVNMNIYDIPIVVEQLEKANKEIEQLNNIINEFEDILKRDIKACNNKFENMFDRNYRRLILEEKLEQLQELKGEDKE